MNDIIVKILPVIENVVATITTDKDDRHDLQQELILKCYANEGKIRRLYVETGLRNWLSVTASNLKKDQHRKVKECSLPGIELICLLEEIQEHNEPKHRIKPTKEMFDVLTDVERMWISLWLDCEFNYLEIQRRTKISRQHAKKRIQEILEKWKQLDIYLPQPL